MLEVAILGGGPAGCLAALALAQAGRRCVLFERRAQHARLDASMAARPLALSYATRLLLERLGAWPAAGATAIRSIHVSQAGVPGRVLLEAHEAGVPALGYVIEYAQLLAALRAKLAASGAEIREGVHARTGFARQDAIDIRVDDAPALAARCAIHAEGSRDDMPGKHYGREAIAGVVQTDPAAAHTAFERFTSEGPLALLPLAGAFAFIWSVRPERAQALQAAPERVFLSELGATLGPRSGELRAVRGRQRLPLVQRLRATRVAPRAVFIGNAAQTLHPVAGQGLNLGLRDAWELAAAIGEAADPGDAALLRRYAAQRRLDAGATVLATDLLASRFASGNPLSRGLGGVALAALDVLPAARRFFTRRMIYGLRALP